MLVLDYIYNENKSIVGILENKGGAFPLQHLIPVHVIIAPELDQDFEYGQTTINKMIAGESSVVDVKNQRQQTKKWDAPVAAAGNS